MAPPPPDEMAPPPSRAGEPSIRPVVALPRAGLSTAAIAAGIIAFAVVLFLVLDARRRSAGVAAVETGTPDRQSLTRPAPPLYIPPAPPPMAYYPLPEEAPAPVLAPTLPPPPPQVVYVNSPTPPAAPPPALAPPPRVTTEPALVVDLTAGQGPVRPAGGNNTESAPGESSITGGRARAGLMANPGTTVPQGTLIPAVLETAFDSTRPGLARAMVTQDVRGFDGRQVLVPRGSRLVGEYRSEVAPGQNRALINWTRLMRPDGAVVALASPAGDPLGRAGVRARVNSHFFERFSGAILQSVLDVGVNLASRPSDNAVVVALPGAVTNTTGPSTRSTNITPTLTVRQGTSISIFVARDLDFSGVGAQQ